MSKQTFSSTRPSRLRRHHGVLLVVFCVSLAAHATDATAPAAPDGRVPSSTPAAVDEMPTLSPNVRITPSAPANGQPFLVEISLPAALRSASDDLVIDHATLGSRRGILLRRTPTSLTILFSVPIEEKEPSLPLRVALRPGNGPAVVVERVIDVVAHPYEESHLQVAKKFTSPPRAARRRARKESKELERVMKTSHPEPLLVGGFAPPTMSAKTSSFGTLRTYNKKRDRSRHLGLDLDGKTGDPIVASERGRVVLAADRYYSGNTVVVDHGGGLFSMYLHLSAFAVQVGETVERGQLIGKMGATGRVTGPHLHFSVKLDGEHLDPESLLALAPAAVVPEAVLSP